MMYRRALFRDRAEAGRRLAGVLHRYRGGDVLVLGIARGGVPVAAEVARELDAELDVIVARKLGAPGQPELAIGAVTPNGGRYINEQYVRELGVTPAYLEAEIARKSAEAREREAHMRDSRPAPRVQGRVVIVVDDGLATGATMRAALHSVRKAQPSRLVMAVPVASREACTALRAEADDLLCLEQPEPFVAVGLHYEEFGATEESEVRRLVNEAAEAREAPAL